MLNKIRDQFIANLQVQMQDLEETITELSSFNEVQLNAINDFYDCWCKEQEQRGVWSKGEVNYLNFFNNWKFEIGDNLVAMYWGAEHHVEDWYYDTDDVMWYPYDADEKNLCK